MTDNVMFVRNKVIGLLFSHKRLKPITYYQSISLGNVILFQQGTHSTINNEIK